MKAILCKPIPLKYLLIRFLSRISPAIIYSPLCLAKLIEIPEPELVDEDWVKIKVTMSGICGSDIGSLNAQESFYLEPYVSKSFVLGHENVGIISKLGKNVSGLNVNDRVVVIPFLACKQRGIKEPCKYCNEGNYALCENVNEGNLPAGLSIGWNQRTSGGWAEYFIAHQSQVIKIPDEVSDESAVMIDSFSCALHAVMQNPPNEVSEMPEIPKDFSAPPNEVSEMPEIPKDFSVPPKQDDAILVYGCGTMGLNTIAGIRALGYKNKIIVIYSRTFQKDMALKLGANIVVSVKEDLFKRITELTNAKIFYPTIGKPVIEGGVDIIYDCVSNSDTINNSLRFLKAKGKYVMIATAGLLKNIDAAPVWFRELNIVGSSNQGYEKYKDSIKSTYEIVIDMIKEKKISLKEMVTHKFPLEKFKSALKVAINKRESAIKVVLVNK